MRDRGRVGMAARAAVVHTLTLEDFSMTGGRIIKVGLEGDY